MVKTYVSSGLIEWHVTINAGGARFPIHFSGGSLVDGKLCEGRFTTNNQVFIKIIENSDYFKNRRIRLIDTSKEPFSYKEDEPHGIKNCF